MSLEPRAGSNLSRQTHVKKTKAIYEMLRQSPSRSGVSYLRIWPWAGVGVHQNGAKLEYGLVGLLTPPTCSWELSPQH
jgi:hypothetical protein